MLGLGLAAGGGAGLTLPGGVLVLEVELLDVPLLPSCFVGLRMPVANRAPGVGLPPPTALPLLSDRSTTACFFHPLTPACTLLGLPLPLFAATPFAGLALGGSIFLRIPLGRRNIP